MFFSYFLNLFKKCLNLMFKILSFDNMLDKTRVELLFERIPREN